MVVVDASAVAAVAFDEPPAPEIVARLSGEAMHAPMLLELEVTNAALSRCRRHPTLAPQFIEALDRMLALPISLHPVNPREVFVLARQTGLTAYDAAYLWLSRALDAALVTADRQLLDAAKRIG